MIGDNLRMLERSAILEIRGYPGRTKGVATSRVGLIGAQLNGASLNDAQLNGAYLNNAKLFRAILNNAYLNDAHLDFAYLFSANLNGAALYNTHLAGADLSYANIANAGFDFDPDSPLGRFLAFRLPRTSSWLNLPINRLDGLSYAASSKIWACALKRPNSRMPSGAPS
jgi:hypothetical protein